VAFFWDKERLFKKSSLRLAYLIAFVCFFILTEMGRKVYRPYVYRNHIDDWGVADTIGNSLGTLTQIFLYLGLANATKVQSYRLIAFVTLGYVAYEVVQPILPRSTFDLKDVFATLAAGIVAAVSVTLIHFFLPETSHDNINAST
jgi:hypothetical protein